MISNRWPGLWARLAIPLFAGCTSLPDETLHNQSATDGSNVGVVRSALRPDPLPPPHPYWGLIEGSTPLSPEPLKGVYFFEGNGESLGYAVDYWRKFSYWPLDGLDESPTHNRHMHWSDDVANRRSTMSEMIGLGINTVHLSFWPASNPTSYDPARYEQYDRLWEVATETVVKIIPAMEIHGLKCKFGRAENYELIDLIRVAVKRWLLVPGWRNLWQRMYDRDGKLRYAIELIDVAANMLAPRITWEGGFLSQDDSFVSVFDEIAEQIKNEIKDEHPELDLDIGFLIDPGTKAPGTGDPAYAGACESGNPPSAPWPWGWPPAAYYPEPGKTRFERAKSFLAILGWRNEAQTNELYFCNSLDPACDNNTAAVPGNSVDRNRETVARSKRSRMAQWIANGLPTILDVSPGYDGQLTWGRIEPQWTPVPNGYIGDNGHYFDDGWRNYMSSMKGAGNVGVFITSWNGFTEGMAVMPGKPKPNEDWESASVSAAQLVHTRYRWAIKMFEGDPRSCDYTHFVHGVAGPHIYGEICKHWQELGGQLGVESEDSTGHPIINSPPKPGSRWGWPTTGNTPTASGNIVARFAIDNYNDFYGFYAKPGGPAHVVGGSNYAKYKAMGEDSSDLGMPTDDPRPTADFCPNGVYNSFEHGRIDFCPATETTPERVWAHTTANEGYPGHERLSIPGALGVTPNPGHPKCLTAKHDIYDGSPLSTWDCVNGDNQQWVYDYNLKFIRSEYNSSYCLDIASGDLIVTKPCNGALSQQWDYVDSKFIGRSTQKCLSASFTLVPDGQELKAWECTGWTNQIYSFLNTGSENADSDGDSYPNILERLQWRTNPYVPDSDILWHQQSTGQLQRWRLSHGAYDPAGEAWIEENGERAWKPAQWKAVGWSHFRNGGCESTAIQSRDIVWQNLNTDTADTERGNIEIWKMNPDGYTVNDRRTVLNAGTGLPAKLASNWSIYAIGDFDGRNETYQAGTTECRNDATTFVVRLNGANIAFWRIRYQNGELTWDPSEARTFANAPTGSDIASTWQIVGAADFDGDGNSEQSELLWFNINNKTLRWWKLNSVVTDAPPYNNHTLPSLYEHSFANAPYMSGWYVGGTLGYGSVIWHSPTTGKVHTWMRRQPFDPNVPVHALNPITDVNPTNRRIGTDWRIVNH